VGKGDTRNDVEKTTSNVGIEVRGGEESGLHLGGRIRAGLGRFLSVDRGLDVAGPLIVLVDLLAPAVRGAVTACSGPITVSFGVIGL